MIQMPMIGHVPIVHVLVPVGGGRRAAVSRVDVCVSCRGMNPVL